MMRIAFTGPGGTGKTTTAKRVAKEIGLSFRPSVVRAVFEEWGWTEARQRSATPEECWRLQKAIFDAKLAEERTFIEGIADRSVLDHFIYTTYRCTDYIERSTLESLEELTLESLEKLDLLIYTPLYGWDPPDDGLRENSRAYRYILDLAWKGFLNKYQIQHLILPDTSLEKRVADVANIIKSLSGRRRAVEGQAG